MIDRLLYSPLVRTQSPITESTESFVGRSPAMLEVFKAIGRVTAETVPVLIRGESSTGKQLVARAIYRITT